MKKLLKLLIVSFLIISQYSCDEEDDSLNGFKESNSEVYKVSLPDTVLVNQAFSLRVKHFGSSGCALFSRAEKSTEAETLKVVVYQKREESLVCTDAIITINTSLNQTFSQEGMKYIKFNKANNLLDSVYVKK